MARLGSIKSLNNLESQKTHDLLVFGMFENSKFTGNCSKKLTNSVNDKLVLDSFTGKEG